MSPIASIVKIAHSEDRERAIVFFLFFARFEYALKRAGFTCEKEEPMADWKKYAGRVAGLMENKEERFKAAIDLLRFTPPMKQFVSDGGLEFRPDRYTGSFDPAHIFELVRRVRNNLFHGGKL